jgi:hypothetical protein
VPTQRRMRPKPLLKLYSCDPPTRFKTLINVTNVACTINFS